jgi:hypothetical protein
MMNHHDTNDSSNIVAAAQRRRAYVSPQLTALGSFAKLTRDAAGGTYTDNSSMQAMMSNMG